MALTLSIRYNNHNFLLRLLQFLLNAISGFLARQNNDHADNVVGNITLIIQIFITNLIYYLIVSINSFHFIGLAIHFNANFVTFEVRYF